MINPFQGAAAGVGGIPRDWLPVTPSDIEDLDAVCAALYIETGGVLVWVAESGEERTATVPDAHYHICGVRAVKATGTTATGIHALKL